MNANEALKNVNILISDLEDATKNNWCDYKRMTYVGWSGKKAYRIGKIYGEVGIFDWWNENLSLSQLKQMRNFLTTAIKLGYTGYVCFKVGASGCSHGMWAHKKESTTGYSPDGACLFHSFRSGDNYWDACDDNEVWLHDKYATEENSCPDFTLAQIKKYTA